jgi:pimeloyl-ACP methyl ester carboxylesterase
VGEGIEERLKNLISRFARSKDPEIYPIETYTADTYPYRIFYRVVGAEDAPKLLLLHGLALSSAYLKPLMRQLAGAGYRVYAPDFPGTGKSDRVPGTTPVAELSNYLINWIDYVGLNRERFHLVAHSAGGQEALKIANQYPHWVESLSLISITGGKGVRSWIPLVLSIGLDALFELNLLVFIAIYRYLHTGVIETLQTTYQHCKEEVRLDAAKLEGDFPTLILWAGRDVVTPLKFGRELSNLISNSQLVILPKATHGLTYSQYRATANALHHFISNVISAPDNILVFEKSLETADSELVEQAS